MTIKLITPISFNVYSLCRSNHLGQKELHLYLSIHRLDIFLHGQLILCSIILWRRRNVIIYSIDIYTILLLFLSNLVKIIIYRNIIFFIYLFIIQEHPNIKQFLNYLIKSREINYLTVHRYTNHENILNFKNKIFYKIITLSKFANTIIFIFFWNLWQITVVKLLMYKKLLMYSREFAWVKTSRPISDELSSTQC